MKLNEARMGSRCTISALTLPADTKRRLECLGFTGKTEITIMNKKRHGAMIVKVRGTRFAMGSDIASGIEVSEAET